MKVPCVEKNIYQPRQSTVSAPVVPQTSFA